MWQLYDKPDDLIELSMVLQLQIVFHTYKRWISELLYLNDINSDVITVILKYCSLEISTQVLCSQWHILFPLFN